MFGRLVWRNALRCGIVASACLLAYAPVAARAAEPAVLRGYNADIAQSSISGISSGAFMAVQFATAWSSVVRGVGVIAGGPFYCAQASSADIINGYLQPLMTATGPCMQGPAPDVDGLVASAEQMATAREIDPTDNLRRQKVYVFHGYNDAVVARSVTDATVAFYRSYLGDAGRGDLFYQTAVGAGHSQVILKQAHANGLNGCADNTDPYIDQCGYDQAGIILQHIYGALNPRDTGKPAGMLKRFDQTTYTAPFGASVLSMGDTGYVYVPDACAQGAACRVHIALHGCKQDAGDIGTRFVEHAGYNAWADNNGIIVLYPQTTASFGPDVIAPVNPQACWDWWGYVTHDASYVTKGGRQIAAIKAMLDALTAGAKPAPPAAGAAGVAPGGLVATDIADDAAALAWTAVAGADFYRVYRAGTQGEFLPAGSVAGPSFGDSGLAPATSYRWRVTAVVGGIEGPASASVAAATRATPPRCDQPGTCPVAQAGN
ncbi:extracellular catalytic domain type 2 short-chain-length polyhydroxyalkanoate depolymerase [Limobrevibacterium gyesilva]|uniref:Fibronectin type-III domain-containing protein n=1 Tax=Limobrevibacterium gyesilva TaxID=2991712 RepID=A0AA42CI54_9PROT|nr:PHB depolymerase family esterase [Limobrevibacterium gyesilva]MCW3475607.1 hypothetical protein [Limobrevibacterium gyesilva]